MTKSLSDYLKDQFDKKVEIVTTGSGGHTLEFSSQVIITDLITNGVSLYDSLDILEKISDKLKRGIHTDKITKLINQTLLEFGYSKEYFINGNIMDDTLILYPNGGRQVLSYKFVKSFVIDLLSDYTVSSKTFRSIVEEYHRVLRGLNAEQIHISTVSQLKSLILKNVLNLDPWNESDTLDQYNELIKILNKYRKFREFGSKEEIHLMLNQVYHSAFKLILLNYNFLPGLTVGATTGQIEKLISELPSMENVGLTSKEIHIIGRIGNLVDKYSRSKYFKNKEEIEVELNNRLESLISIVNLLVHRGILKWLFVISEGGIELFSTKDGKTTSSVNLLVAAGMSGIEKLVEEITEFHPQLIVHEDGVIIIEKRKGYSVVGLSKMESVLLLESIKEYCNQIDRELSSSICNFSGETTELSSSFLNLLHDVKLHQLFFN